MSWRSLSARDVAAHLTQAEIDAYRQMGDFPSDADPVEDVCSAVAAECRMRLRKNFFVRLSPRQDELPPELISPAADIAVFKILKRFPQDISDPRRLAYENAVSLLQQIQNDEVRPESYSGDDAEPAAPDEDDMRNVPVYVQNIRPNLLR